MAGGTGSVGWGLQRRTPCVPEVSQVWEPVYDVAQLRKGLQAMTTRGHGLSRNTDPSTSHSAGVSVNVTRRGCEVLDIMRSEDQANWIADEIDEKASYPGLWRRINELAEQGMIVYVGDGLPGCTRLGRSGRYQATFTLTEFGRNTFYRPPRQRTYTGRSFGW